MESLEEVAENSLLMTEKPTLQQELLKSVKEYPTTWKNYFKNMAPAVVVSALGSATAQWAANKLGYNSDFIMTASAYIGGYIPGYTTFFLSEYSKNRHKYPKLFSKEFGEFVGTFLAADYVADLTTFTPAFVASNLWLKNNTEINPAIRGFAAWGGASLLYISSISALHPLTRRINSSINGQIRKLVKKVRGSKN